MKKLPIIILNLIIISALLTASDKDIQAKIKAKSFYKSTEIITLNGSKSDFPDKKKKTTYSWSVIDENTQEFANNQNDEKIDLQLNEGRYTAKLTIKQGKKKSTDTKEFVVAEKDTVQVTIKVIPPDDTPGYDYIFLGHNVENHKEWVPYASRLTKGSDSSWVKTFTLETGRIFKFQPTRGSWGTKGRDKHDSDFNTSYMPFRDETVTISGFTWGNVVDNKKLQREPLLVLNSEDYSSMKVVWNTDEKNLFYGENETNQIEASVKIYEYGMEALINDLKPGKTYYFRLGLNGEKISFTTPDNDGSFTFAAVADGQNIKSSIEKLTKKLVTYKPSLIVYAGDLMNNGLKAFSWDLTFFTPFVPFIKGIPLAVAPGNHEESAVLFNRYLGQEKNWKTFVHENTRFLMIDAESTYVKGSEQYNFIEKALKENKSTWIIVVNHESPYAFIPRHYSNLLVREELVPLFEQYNVNLVLSGHNHVYERTKPINKVTYVTLPCLGSNKPKEAVDEKDARSEIQVFNNNGFAIINVDPKGIRVSVEVENGDFIDTFSIVK
ncbi:MAG: hypothetical protein A2015_06335 [Spirochaetes bacterium GWF1_31_7]|nr:MAG: hypothetical protein A2Y30_08170 [Spirochaetes bacterium GWE1_32_154]OHD51365.1 MAG: hypothetical protein A2Y29_14555 [Spirochaetes bacterium GWE2_31_10]OHD53091.1 MAG: hypothetical protein A2015_06335 [Spirochaetes bacterium GWF1_31_7]OHD79281.1 MAG: hypothetical protein A2355_06025 [Spirochaetes bacterium RIFOXYB1_FULL_32_8]HBD95130.1 hypothetical protein [Spirochaetia bacterium]